MINSGGIWIFGLCLQVFKLGLVQSVCISEGSEVAKEV